MKRLQITHESFQSTCLETRLVDLYLTALRKCFQIKHFWEYLLEKLLKEVFITNYAGRLKRFCVINLQLLEVEEIA